MTFGPNYSNPKYKANFYDDYYIIFGNSELRIQSLEDKVFCNFAIVCNFFETKGKNVDILLGKGKGDQGKFDNVLDYEVYSLEF